jgi:hypothetical protein
MAIDFSNSGAFNVNGQWATTVRYEATIDQGAVTDVQLRFFNGGSRVASARVSAQDARELLGENNYAAIVEASASARSGGTGIENRAVKGGLHGKSLEFRQVTLTGYEASQSENTIAFDSRVPRMNEAAAREPHDQTDRQGTLTTRDYVVGAAHAAQLASVGGPAVHGAAQAIGAVDAAKLAVDAANGKDVRAVDAAAAAASVTLTSGAGGPAVQTAAKVGAAVGAADTVRRTLNTADAAEQRLAESTDAQSDREEQTRLRLARATTVPDAVAERFLNVDDRYYFPDKTLAFRDRGTKLKAETHNLEVIRSLVAIAESRDWQAISVTGTPEFRREVWREASLRGIDVRGYEAADLEREELRRAMERRHGPNVVSRESLQRNADQREQDPAQAQSATGHSIQPHRSERSGSQDMADVRTELLTGRLVESGAAPYKFDPKEGLSYYIKLQTDRGDRVVWGIDLERALVESQTEVKVGDVVAVENRGSKPVTVKAPRRDNEGKVVGEQGIATHRNAWVVERPSYFDERAEKAAAFRNGEAARRELVQQYPDLTSAVVSLWLGEQFAARMIERREDRERVVALVKKRLAQALERGEAINTPKLKQEVARKLDAVAPARRVTKPPREREPEEPPHVRA